MFRKLSEIFSLTGAGFNCSSYQQPRRGRGSDSITLAIENITLAGLLFTGMLYGGICFKINQRKGIALFK